MIKQLLNNKWLIRFDGFNKLIVGFSGGLDSTVLLHALASHPLLQKKILAVYINHGISKNATLWQKHCDEFCQNLAVQFISQTVQFDQSANIEERARAARYEAFSSLMTEHDCLVLGHHQDDQAETLLLQLFRGTGIDGLAAMSESTLMELGVVIRPFLTCSREQLEDYAKAHHLIWVEDESNQDSSYSRNYLRQKIIPLLAEKWPGVVGNIARTAIHCQEAKANLNELALIDSQNKTSLHKTLSIRPLDKLSQARLSNVLRVWLKENQIQLPSSKTIQRLIHELIESRDDATPIVAWGGIQVRRYQETLYLVTTPQQNYESLCIDWVEFPKSLIIPAQSIALDALKAKQGVLLSPSDKIQVRFRQGGETITWHGQTKQLKKLFQEWDIPPWLRDSIPLIYVNGQLAIVVGYAINDVFYATDQDNIWEFVKVTRISKE